MIEHYVQYKTINVAVVGLGIGEQHVSALLSHPQANVTAVCDLDQEKIAYVLNKYQLPSAISKNFSDILNDENIHMVSLASFDDAHYEQIMSCLHHERHVFVEKPLCQNKDQLREIFSLWKKGNVGISSNLILRKAPLYVWLKEAIAGGELGEIYAIDADYLYGRLHKITQGWRANVDDYSVMTGGGIHMIDLMLRFVGQNPVSVESSVNKIATKNTAFRYPDFHTATYHFKNGVIGRITANFGCMHRHQHVLKIFGTKATFVYDDMGARIHRNRDEEGEIERISLAPKPSHKGELLLDFINNILSGDYNNHVLKEFDLMSVVMATDQSVVLDQKTTNIRYLSNMKLRN